MPPSPCAGPSHRDWRCPVRCGSSSRLTGFSTRARQASNDGHAMDVRLIDTTFRDGAQSLWAGGIRTGMIEAVAEDMDQAGFDAIEVPVGGNYLKKIVRDSKEDPWEMAR